MHHKDHEGLTSGTSVIRRPYHEGEAKLSKHDYVVAFGWDTRQQVGAKLVNQFGSLDNVWGQGSWEMSLEQFEQKCKEIGVSRWNAQRAYAEADVDGSGTLSQREYYHAFGAKRHDMEAKLKAKHESISAAFKVVSLFFVPFRFSYCGVTFLHIY